MMKGPKQPNIKKLEKRLQALPRPEEQNGNPAVEETFEMYGIDPAVVDERFRQRLEREVRERRARGEEVPQPILDALESFSQRNSSSLDSKS